MTHISTKEFQESLSPAEALQMLKDGNERYLNRKEAVKEFYKQVEATTNGQWPYAAILGCIDSRVPSEIVFDQGVGDLFNARVAGNFANTDILGSLEYACAVAGSKLIVVLGHTSCGAVKSACDGVELGNITHLLSNITPVVDSVETVEGEARNATNESFVQNVADKNVLDTVAAIKAKSSILNELCESGKINIVGAMYDVKTGKVSWL